jgi:hypothetical protein
MMSLGTLLVKHGWITKQQLGLAISKQREIGGRLGTCLLEMGAVSEDLLNRSLAEQQGVPSAAAEDLTNIASKVSRLLPAPIAIRYRAVPFRATHTDVDIAMLEVDNLWLQDELSFIVGRRLNVYIANEARIVEALARYYKAPCSERFVKLLVQLNRVVRERQTREHHPDSRLVAVSSDDESSDREEPAVRYDTLSPDIEAGTETAPLPAGPKLDKRREMTIPVSEQELESLGAAPAEEPGGVEPPSTPYLYSRDAGNQSSIGIAEAEIALENAADVHEIGQVLLSVASQEFTRAGLLQATPSMIRGWLASGPGLDHERLEQYRVSFDEPSIFLNLREGGSFFLGTLPEMPAHLSLAACWHKDLSDESAVFPIRVRDRLVALVYGDCGPLGLADLDLDHLRELCASASRAFERYIVEQKQRREADLLPDRQTG